MERAPLIHPVPNATNFALDPRLEHNNKMVANMRTLFGTDVTPKLLKGVWFHGGSISCCPNKPGGLIRGSVPPDPRGWLVWAH